MRSVIIVKTGNKIMKGYWIVIFFCCIINKPLSAQVDTSYRLSLNAFMDIVRQYHPVVKQYTLQVQRAKAAVASSRGAFDPAFYTNTERKTFDSKLYYSYINPELKIPTWYGIEVKAGAEDIVGDNRDPQTTFGQSSYLGVTVPLAKNLLMDARRAALQQSKIFVKQSQAEQLNAVNDLLFNAYEVYWNWTREYELYRVLSNAVKINEDRLKLVRIGWQQGDRAAIDTTEALAQLQSFLYQQSDAYMRWTNARLELSNFCWLNNSQPYSLPTMVTPDNSLYLKAVTNMPLPVLENVLVSARLQHPKLKIYDLKLDVLEVERKLKFQSLLPSLNLSGNLLNKGYNVAKGADLAFYQNNYKFGINVGMPLFLRQARGDYRQTKLKISETNLLFDQSRLQIENKVRMYFNELTALQQQVGIYEEMYKNYLRLFRGEEERFRTGESSLFLVNTRENKALETLQKLIELRAKFYKSTYGVQWAAGQLR
jgi:outer membrane protein TolC